MNADQDRDRLLEDALTHELGAAPVVPATAACLDAETLAAWMDGGLDAQTVAMAEAHASSCARCQALIGTLARVTPPVIQGHAVSVRLWRWWLAPLAVGAAAATLWMVVPSEQYSAPPERLATETAAESQLARARDAVAPPPARPEAALPSTAEEAQNRAKGADNATTKDDAARKNEAAGTAGFNEAKPKLEALQKRADPARDSARAEPKELEERRAAAPAAAVAAPAPAAPPPAAPAIGQLRAQVALPSDVQITASASPSSTVSWFVGRAGVVLLTTDGRTVTRVSFPESTDLTAVTATDARIAVVTTVDGRIFRTEDAGRTWRRQ